MEIEKNNNFIKIRKLMLAGIIINFIVIIAVLTTTFQQSINNNEIENIWDLWKILKVVLLSYSTIAQIISLCFCLWKYKHNKCVSIINVVSTFISFNIISGILFAIAYLKNRKLNKEKKNKSNF